VIVWSVSVSAEDRGTIVPFGSAEQSLAEYRRSVAPFIAKHCVECHGEQSPEKDLVLTTLEPDMKTTASAARWAVVVKQLATGEMPPEGKSRPDTASVKGVTDWIHAEMKRAGKRIAVREAAANGNLLAHELLFDPKQAAPFDAPPRLRRLSPELYDGFARDIAKDAGVSQPFSPGGKSLFKDSGTPKVDEPITAQLIRNALAIVEKQTAFKLEDGKLKPLGQIPKEFLALLDETQPPSDAQIETAIHTQFDRALRRKPSAEELSRFVALTKKNIADAGPVTGARYSLAAVLMLPEAIFRSELGGGANDSQGRVRLTAREIAFALSQALTDRRPEAWLLDEAEKGKLDTRDGVEAAVRRMLDDPKLDRPRIPRFFREYFGYAAATEVFKNDKENPEHDPRVLIEDTDRLVQLILEQDRDVLAELLTTNKSFVAYRTAADTKKKRAEALAKFEAEKAENPEKFKTKQFKPQGRNVYESYNLTDFPDEQPVALPSNERAGILTQPSWLVAFSQSESNHAILRGKWVRERLLGGVVPDIPITVDAQLPIAPEKTLRERMEVTRQDYCWKCHQLMNPVGLPFEMFDHFGRYRATEPVLDADATAKHVDGKGKSLGPVTRGVPVDATGSVTGFGDVPHAIEMLHRLAKSEHVEQVFVRHAFRYWLGRNESLGDAPSLQAAHQAYRASSGSMKSLIAALLTSESFLYRIPSQSK
jgi:hypothetical protein